MCGCQAENEWEEEVAAQMEQGLLPIATCLFFGCLLIGWCTYWLHIRQAVPIRSLANFIRALRAVEYMEVCPASQLGKNCSP